MQLFQDWSFSVEASRRARDAVGRCLLAALTEQMRNAMMEGNLTVQASEASAVLNIPGNGNAAELMPPVG